MISVYQIEISDFEKGIKNKKQCRRLLHLKGRIIHSITASM